jgi:hypothetical protein
LLKVLKRMEILCLVHKSFFEISIPLNEFIQLVWLVVRKNFCPMTRKKFMCFEILQNFHTHLSQLVVVLALQLQQTLVNETI